MPETWKEANIVLVPKDWQDFILTRNYRPIPLLNNYYKLFTIILVERLEINLGKNIHEEQCGFLPKRQLKDNVRTASDILDYLEKQWKTVHTDILRCREGLWQFELVFFVKGFGDYEFCRYFFKNG